MAFVFFGPLFPDWVVFYDIFLPNPVPFFEKTPPPFPKVALLCFRLPSFVHSPLESRTSFTFQVPTSASNHVSTLFLGSFLLQTLFLLGRVRSVVPSYKIVPFGPSGPPSPYLPCPLHTGGFPSVGKKSHFSFRDSSSRLWLFLTVCSPGT